MSCPKMDMCSIWTLLDIQNLFCNLYNEQSLSVKIDKLDLVKAQYFYPSEIHSTTRLGKWKL